ncbi:hypothetical protein CVT25_006114 [Psilocybe cyanescens]|uniref:Uncharacterized protein n=1 Tax=Psilocybe cyanescens TaxID=93625 RepID=A0A409X723_PSICY|nr:hypothetical protein CVT25_006114 [Psilocybe cyanescens]
MSISIAESERACVGGRIMSNSVSGCVLSVSQYPWALSSIRRKTTPTIRRAKAYRNMDVFSSSSDMSEARDDVDDTNLRFSYNGRRTVAAADDLGGFKQKWCLDTDDSRSLSRGGGGEHIEVQCRVLRLYILIERRRGSGTRGLRAGVPSPRIHRIQGSGFQHPHHIHLHSYRLLLPPPPPAHHHSHHFLHSPRRDDWEMQAQATPPSPNPPRNHTPERILQLLHKTSEV